MRIVDRKTFLSLPEGTVYSKISEGFDIDELCVKMNSAGYGNDWIYIKINDFHYGESSSETFDKLEEMEGSGENIDINCEETMRDGLYENDQMFAVFSKYDIIHMIAALSKGITN